MQSISTFIKEFKAMGLYPPFVSISSGVNEPECIINNKKYLQFSSNNYLGFTENLEVKNAAIEAINKYGVGPGGSRVISGNVDIIEKLEKEIAILTKTEDCLTFPTGYMANQAIFKAIMDPLMFNKPYETIEGVIFSDECNHGSIIDGCQLTKARKIVFNHNDIDDLKEKLKNNPAKNRLIVTEGVFSLDGEVLDLPAYVKVAREFSTKLMIDDAHGVGILGENGGGVPELYDLQDGVDILMGCMDKAFGGTGGYLCGKKELIDYLRIASRSSILSSALPTMMSGAMLKSLELIKKSKSLRSDLITKAKYLKDKLIGSGFKILGNYDLPAIPLYLGEEELGIKFADKLFDNYILCPLVRWPAVPEKMSRLRIIVMANHTHNQVDKFIEVLRKVGKELKIIN